jgi:hypothetical protein
MVRIYPLRGNGDYISSPVVAGRVSQGAGHQDDLIGGKPAVVK